jgi:hypothetical protein
MRECDSGPEVALDGAVTITVEDELPLEIQGYF